MGGRLFLLLLCTVLISACASNEVIKKLDECNLIVRLEPQDPCYRDIVLEIRDPNICEKTRNSYECYKQMAVWLENHSICDKSPKGTVDGCFMWAGHKLKNISACKRIKNELNKNMCLRWVADILNDSSICDEIEGVENREKCQLEVQRNLQ